MGDSLQHADPPTTNLTDADIINRFQDIFHESASWALQNSVEWIENKPLVKWSLIDQGIILRDENLPPHQRFDMGASGAAEILLEAALNNFLVDFFLDSPYTAACVESINDLQMARANASALYNTERYMLEGTVTFSIPLPRIFPFSLWQRISFIPANVITMMTENLTQALNGRRLRLQGLKVTDETVGLNRLQKFCAQAVDDFLDSFTSLIDMPLSMEGSHGLQDVMRRMLFLSRELGGLNRDVKYKLLRDVLDVPFNGASKTFVPDVAVNLEPGSTRLDGVPINIVVQPMVYGRAYDEESMEVNEIAWIPGTAWVPS